MPGEPAPTPDLALQHLLELSSDVRAAVLLDSRGKVAASGGEASDFERMAELAGELLEHAREAGGGTAEQLEVAVQGGTVYALASPKWAFVAVAARSALSSLMFYDLRSALSQLEQRKAA